MTRLRGSWTAAVTVTLFLLTACARPGDVPGGAGPSGHESSAPADADALVLRVEHIGGFVAPDQMVGRLPVVSVYTDGRVITQGPQILIYPGPALPNLLVQQLDPATVRGLVDKAVEAGVRSGADLGQPGVADAPTTRITVAAPGGTRTLDAVALTEAQADDPQLTVAQRAARAKLAAFVQELSDLSAAKGMPEAQPYQPEAVAALARPYTKPSDGLPKQPDPVAWPGPALPGETLSGTTGCVTASGSDAAKVLAAATAANAITPWTSGGKQWSVVFRPLLPDETGCAALKATR
ncbi:MAG TPA: hypothetical protein VGP91_16570 [Actinoplanes sp.]|jgi:hypothetical protein|nr:hypothetical protein [Actinoplanes sp.]